MVRLAVSPFLAAVPLFTLTGFLLTNGGTPGRLLALFRALFGWIPGGTAIVALLLCTFFTVFTGGSGVTILALGGLLMPALLQDGYRERFSLGLLTASGSLGLLFPPALPLILYGISAQAPIEELFLGGILPGLLLLAFVIGWAVRERWRDPTTTRHPFRWSEARAALLDAKLELALPVIALVAIFGGFATIVEAAALTAAYTLAIQLVRRDVSLPRDVLPAFRDCIAMLGGVLIILTCAIGLTSWIVDAEVPGLLFDWVKEHVDSRLAFLLWLNLFLLAVGCFMDIYSATFVVVPLILPLGEHYGIHPVHLGIIFIANLELGYLTPPVGLNLFLASYRFEKPLLEVYRAAVPLLVILGIGVLVITYVPWLSTLFRAS
jgi:tripartite ATP-independent transporter DctM subunit